MYRFIRPACLLISATLWFLSADIALACVEASSSTCLTFCESSTALNTAAKTGKKTVEQKIKRTKNKINDKIRKTDEANTAAVKASATSATNNTAALANAVGSMYTASDIFRQTLAKESAAYDAARDLMPTVEDCINISNRRGIYEGKAIQSAAAVSMNAEAYNSFQNVPGSRDSKGTLRKNSKGGNVRAMYDEWKDYYCVESTNNGQNPSDCGSKRPTDEKFLENLDLKLTDILFKPQTIPRKDVLDAQKSIIFHLGAKPVTTVPPRDFSNPEAQDAMMRTRTIAAKKNLADAVFAYLTSKRLPVIPSDQAKTVLKRDMPKTGDLNQLVDNMQDKISFSQWLDVFTNLRYLGTDYYSRVQKMNDVQAQKEVINLMSLRLIQQRERYQMLEKMLAVAAADYALDVDNVSGKGSVVGSSD